MQLYTEFYREIRSYLLHVKVFFFTGMTSIQAVRTHIWGNRRKKVSMALSKANLKKKAGTLSAGGPSAIGNWGWRP